VVIWSEELTVKFLLGTVSSGTPTLPALGRRLFMVERGGARCASGRF